MPNPRTYNVSQYIHDDVVIKAYIDQTLFYCASDYLRFKFLFSLLTTVESLTGI